MENGFNMNKKGSARDIGLMAVTLFGVGLVSFLLLFVYNSVSDIMIASPEINGTAAAQVLKEHQGTMAQTDYLTFSVLIGFTIGIVLTGWLVGGITPFMILYVIFLIVIGAVSGILQYVWESISLMSIFGNTLSLMPLTNFLLSNLTLFVVITGFLGLISMYISGQRALQ